MLQLRIGNFKSIDSLEIELGRVNLFIGENGCGKTSILEAVGMAAAGAMNSLSNSALRDRGIRVTEPRWMRSGFEDSGAMKPIDIAIAQGSIEVTVSLAHDGTPFGEWFDETHRSDPPARGMDFDAIARYVRSNFARDLELHNFLTYAPREDVLRDLARDSDVEPIGVHGEGLFRLLQVLDSEGQLPLVKEDHELPALAQ